MTKKHFIQLAEALKINAPDSNSCKAETLLFRSIVGAVASVCRRANSRFDLGRFEVAAGVAAIKTE
jgi:hypothetical protein